MMRTKKTVSKAELVSRLADKMGADYKTAELAYQGMVAILAENISAGMGTSFRGVGIVTAEHRLSRTVKVPTLAEPKTIPERIVCNFEMVRRFGATLRGGEGSLDASQ